MAIILVGSKNPTKIRAVQAVFDRMLLKESFSVQGVETDVVGEFEHPKSLEETIRGAKRRAEAAFKDCVYGVGMEGGLIKTPEVPTGYLETTACAIYDGKRFAIGLSSSFEWPPQVLRAILDGQDGSQAFRGAGLTTSSKIGNDQGAISVLTDGYIDRTKQNEEAVVMSLLQLMKPELYGGTNE